jgi:orotidine-5'-phosphate decarboxylase
VTKTQRPALTFCREIVEATSDLVCAYKPNLAFWLAEGSKGLASLQDLISSIPPHIPVILDAKSGDVGHTAEAYARAAFDMLGAHACTANAYLGGDSLRPFLERDGSLVFVLARTSNPSAPELQDLPVQPSGGEHSTVVFEQVAALAMNWHARWPGAVGLVVGATYPSELRRLRTLAPSLPFLIPGIGAQGGDLEPAVVHGPTAGGIGPVINSSRGILYAWQAEGCRLPAADYAEAARLSAVALRDRINEARRETPRKE